MSATAIEMPKFNFGKMSFETDEQLAEEEAKNGSKNDKYLKPGLFEATITEVEFKGMCSKDPTWVSLGLTYTAAGDKSIRGYLQVPTEDIKYGTNGTLMPFRTLKTFCAAMGHPVTVKNVKDVVKSLFAKPEKLVGLPVKITVGYQKGYVKYAGKKKDGGSTFHLYDRDNNLVRDADNVAVEFSDRDAAVAYGAENGIAVDLYPSVTNYEKSVSSSPASDSSPW